MAGAIEPVERLFVGVPLPKSLKNHVQAAQAALPRVSGLKLLPEQQWHVTLAFIGEVDRETASVARRVVEAVPVTMGGESRMGGFLMLPSSTKTRVVTLKIEDDEGVWAELYETIATSLETAGVMQREARPFRPHLTVARMKTPGRVRPRSEISSARFPVDCVCLYRSELRREGAQYTVLARTVFNKRRRKAEA